MAFRQSRNADAMRFTDLTKSARPGCIVDEPGRANHGSLQLGHIFKESTRRSSLMASDSVVLHLLHSMRMETRSDISMKYFARMVIPAALPRSAMKCYWCYTVCRNVHHQNYCGVRPSALLCGQ